jgi:hypothetical protein
MRNAAFFTVAVILAATTLIWPNTADAITISCDEVFDELYDGVQYIDGAPGGTHPNSGDNYWFVLMEKDYLFGGESTKESVLNDRSLSACLPGYSCFEAVYWGSATPSFVYANTEHNVTRSTSPSGSTTITLETEGWSDLNPDSCSVSNNVYKIQAQSGAYLYTFEYIGPLFYQ